MDLKHIKAIFYISIFGVIAGIYLSSGKFPLIILGIICLIIDLIYEYHFLKEMDTREAIEKTKKELKKYVEDARKLKNEIDISKKEIENIKDSVFDVFSKNGFKTVEERLKDIESQLGGNYGKNNLEILKDDIDKIKHKMGWYF